MQGCLRNLRWKVQPSLPRAPNRSRKCHEDKVTLSVFAGLQMLTSASHCVFGSFFCSFHAKVFSLLVHSQGASVTTLVLATHHFSDHGPNRVWAAALSSYFNILGEKICLLASLLLVDWISLVQVPLAPINYGSGGTEPCGTNWLQAATALGALNFQRRGVKV